MKRGFKMAEHIIENDYLKVTIEDKGAELLPHHLLHPEHPVGGGHRWHLLSGVQA